VKDSLPKATDPQHQGLTGALRKQLRSVSRAVPGRKSRPYRFEIYGYLEAVYATYRKWKYRKVAKRTAHLVARQLDIPWTKGASPIRIIIEATFATVDPKQKSRWVRALQYAESKDVSARDLSSLFRSRQGVAGCARLAARRQPKRQRRQGDWA
jgi:hypothetical protein